MTEVVVTGVGAVSCLGTGVAALTSAMADARVVLPEPVNDPPARLRMPLIHRVTEDPPGAAEWGRTGALAVVASREALDDAGLDPAVSTRIGAVVGTCLGDGVAAREGLPTFRAATAVGDLLGRAGVNISVSNACAAGGFALSMAADLIRAGELDVVIAGGADSYSRVGWACMDRMGALDPERCRPFDADRRGTVLGEGAGMLVLESSAHARARGARIRARLAGEGWSCDAGHLTAPEPTGAQIERAMREALGGRAEVGCVIPHGTGTVHNDQVESRALRAVLGSRLDEIPLYSLKPLVGHTGGTSAALGAVAAVTLLDHGKVPANVPIANQDPACAVHLPREAVSLVTPRVLVNAYAFGGNNSSILLERAA